jgi:hypothetical protein
VTFEAYFQKALLGILIQKCNPVLLAKKGDLSRKKGIPAGMPFVISCVYT